MLGFRVVYYDVSTLGEKLQGFHRGFGGSRVVARMRCFGVSDAQVEHRPDCQPVEVKTLQREDEELIFMNVLLMI